MVKLITTLVLLAGTTAGSTPRVTVPAGTELQLRFLQLVASHSTKKDTPVKAVVVQPVEVDGQVAIARGTVISGTVAEVRRVGLGFARERAFVRVVFDQIDQPDGQPKPISLLVTAIDDAREAVDANGRINGIRASASFGSTLSGLTMSAGFVDPMLLGFTSASALSAFRIPESEIIFPAGTEFRARLQAPFDAAAAGSEAMPEFAAAGAQRTELEALVRNMPYRTQTEAGAIPSDVTNLIFVGSRDAVAAAFDAAGWGQTDTLNARSTYRAVRAVVENQGYREAPMSILVLDAKRPQFTYAKTLNTFFKRHHLRIFADMGTLDGQPVWTSSSTHDSGIGFSRRAKTLIHVIDENIDHEREKVVNDLILTGCVDGVARIARPWLADNLTNSTGDTLRTDKRVAVIRLNDCQAPRRADFDVAAGAVTGTGEKGASIVRHGVRNTLLTIKQDFWRGNIFYQGYSVVKMAVGALRGKKAEPGDAPRTVEVAGEQFMVVQGAEKMKAHPAPEKTVTGFDHIAAPKSYDPRLIFSFSGSTNEIGQQASGVLNASLLVTSEEIGTVALPIRMVSRLRPEWGFTGRATLRSWTHISQEFGYSYNKMRLKVSVENDFLPPIDIEAGAQQRQFTYNLLFHPLERGRRVRPYAAFGPVVQLIRLDEAAAQTNGTLKFAFKSASLLATTWDFGHTPPLQGGGVFQMGLQYGAGVKVNLTPSLVLRSDFRETLSAQPDFFSKSRQGLVDAGVIPTSYVDTGRFRLRQFSIGLGIGF